MQMVEKVSEQADGKFLKLVDDTWLRMHEHFHNLEARPLELSKRCPKSLCYYARMCVCNRPDLRAFVKALVYKLRKLCHKDAPMRVPLDRCELVVRLATLDVKTGDHSEFHMNVPSSHQF